MSEVNVDSLKKDYDKAVAEVQKTAPNTPERYEAMQAKLDAFTKFRAASDAKQESELAASRAETQQAAADAAVKDAKVAKAAVAEAGKLPKSAAELPKK